MREAQAGEGAFAMATRAGGLGLQRLADTTEEGAFGTIVEDEAQPGPGQIRRTDFLTKASAAIESIANSELAPFGKTAKDCPYLERYLRYYRDRPAKHIERVIARYARPRLSDPDSLLQAVLERVRRAIVLWARTGRVDVPSPSGPPDESVAAPVLGFDGPVGGADPQALRARLGGGHPLDGATRSRMERGFGRDFGDVRVHTDGSASRAATALSARAFTVGTDVAFGAGQYRPGTTRGDLMLAHELAHVVQQADVSRPVTFSSSSEGLLETDADQAAISAVAKSGVAPEAIAQHVREHRPVTGAGLRLQRCGSSEEAQLPEAPESFPGKVPIDDQDVPPLPDQPPATGQPPAGQAPGVATPADTADLIFLNVQKWSDVSADDLLMIRGRAAGSGRDQIFVVPARGLVQMAVLPQEPARAAGTTTSGASTSGGPAFMLPAVGHAQVILVRTARGVGMLVDVTGTPTGRAVPVVHAASLQAMQHRYNIARIDAATITHAHADHSTGLGLLVRQGNFTGSDVYVHRGWESATVGPLAAAYGDLTAANSTRFPAGWQPQTLASQTFTGPAGATYTRSTLPIGGATVEFAVQTSAMAAFNAALASGNWRQASGLADAAGGLKLITSHGRTLLDVGDTRPGAIESLYNTMGEAAFNQFVGRAEAVSGLHHLGAISGTGLLRLARALGSGSRPVTVIAQVGAPYPVSERLVTALTQIGWRVVYVEEATGALKGITIRAGGAVTQTGGREFGIEKGVGEAQERVGRIRGAIRALEGLPSYGEDLGLSRQGVVGALQQEAQRLENLLARRQEIALQDLARARNRPTTERDLETNLRDLYRVEAMEQRIGKDELQRLARLGPETIAAYTRELKEAQARGRASARLFKLVSQVDPAAAKRILLDELGRPMSRNQQRSAWRRAHSRLKAQARAQLAMTVRGGAPVPAAGRGFALFGLAMQAWEIAEPFVSMAFEENRTQDRKDFYTAFHDLVWWNEKGLVPLAVGLDDSGNPVEGTVLQGRVEKRLYEDLPAAERSKLTLSAQAQSSTALKQLYIPEMNQWPADRRDLFWRSLLMWTSAHVNSYDDYASEIREIPGGAPIREDPAAPKDKTFGERPWQIRVGVPSGGHIEERWQASPDLTHIMNATVKRMMSGTEARIEEKWAKRSEAVPSVAGTWVAGEEKVRGSDQPTARAHAGSGRIGVYEFVHAKVVKIERFRFWDERPQFLVYASEGTRSVTPKGYAWVSGANYNTAAAIRGTTTWHYVGTIKVPREPNILDVNSPDFMRNWKPEEYMSPDQLAAHNAALRAEPGVYRRILTERESTTFHSEITIYEQGPNVGGMVLVKLSDITQDPEG